MRQEPDAVFFLKIALLTCAFYVAIAVLLEVGVYAVSYWKGGILVAYSARLYAAIFAVVWALSFSIAWRIFLHGVRSRMSH